MLFFLVRLPWRVIDAQLRSFDPRLPACFDNSVFALCCFSFFAGWLFLLWTFLRLKTAFLLSCVIFVIAFFLLLREAADAVR